MFRKAILVLAATAALGATALAPVSASARDSDNWRNHHHSRDHRWHRPAVSFRFYAPRAYAYVPRCHFVRRWVHNYWGWHLRRVEVCR